MKFTYRPQSKLEKFGVKVYPHTKSQKVSKIVEIKNLAGILNKTKLGKFGGGVYSALVENFSQTFFVGGMVRDLLLKRKVADIDIATEAKPDAVAKILSDADIKIIADNKRFGSIIAKQGNMTIEITSFRQDLKSSGRYPKVVFISNPKIDSQRRDFTINSFYLKAKNEQIFDFHKGSSDLKLKQIKFIGAPAKRISEDPLRIIRALRFALTLNFKLEKKTKIAIKKSFAMVKTLTKTKLEKEINKIKIVKKKNILQKVINSPKLLDKYFK